MNRWNVYKRIDNKRYMINNIKKVKGKQTFHLNIIKHLNRCRDTESRESSQCQPCRHRRCQMTTCGSNDDNAGSRELPALSEENSLR